MVLAIVVALVVVALSSTTALDPARGFASESVAAYWLLKFLLRLP